MSEKNNDDDDESKVFIRGLPFDISEDEIRASFESFGVLRIIVTQQPLKNSSYAVLIFSSSSDVEKVIHEKGGFKIRSVHVFPMRFESQAKRDGATYLFKPGADSPSTTPIASPSASIIVIVRNVPSELEEEDLFDIFSKYGDTSMTVTYTNNGRNEPQEARVNFKSLESAQKAVELDGVQFYHTVRKSFPKSETDGDSTEPTTISLNLSVHIASSKSYSTKDFPSPTTDSSSYQSGGVFYPNQQTPNPRPPNQRFSPRRSNPYGSYVPSRFPGQSYDQYGNYRPQYQPRDMGYGRPEVSRSQFNPGRGYYRGQGGLFIPPQPPNGRRDIFPEPIKDESNTQTSTSISGQALNSNSIPDMDMGKGRDPEIRGGGSSSSSSSSTSSINPRLMNQQNDITSYAGQIYQSISQRRIPPSQPQVSMHPQQPSISSQQQQQQPFGGKSGVTNPITTTTTINQGGMNHRSPMMNPQQQQQQHPHPQLGIMSGVGGPGPSGFMNPSTNSPHMRYPPPHSLRGIMGDGGHMVAPPMQPSPQFGVVQSGPREFYTHRFDPNVRRVHPNLFVFHLPQSIDDRRLYQLFSPYGEVVSVKVIRDDMGSSKGYGFVLFKRFEEALHAIKCMDGAKLEHKYLKVSFKSDKGQRKDGKSRKKRQR